MPTSPSPLRFNGLVRTGQVFICRRDLRLILAMIDAGLKDQQIHAFFSQPGRDFNHNRISALRSADRSLLPPPATHAQLQAFLDCWSTFPPVSHFWYCLDEQGLNGDAWQVAYRFHPVGQGMLHSGELRQGRRPPFTWVYDCGSVTAQAQVESELDDLCTARGAAHGSKPELDFVALSHFDADHISGLVHLLGLFEVKMILLPFLQLWQRFWIATSADDLDADFLQFLIDPAGYLLGVDGGAEARIVFVSPSESYPPPPPAPDPGPPEGPRGELDVRPMKLGLETERVPVVVDGEIPGVTGLRLSEAEFLKAESVLHIDGLWEFVPYNDAHQAERCPAGFPATVEPLIETLLAAANPADRKKALDALKAHYDATFGGSAYRRNIISLFLYGGPVSTPVEAYFGTGETLFGNMAWHHEPDWSRLSASHFSMLFTGDGSLNSKPRRTGFETFFTPDGRLDKASVFQVMHHGASGNSSPEVAALVAPRASIFCSDPSKGDKHPHADVLRQFWPYNCIQVDDAIGWLMLGVFKF
ncbi:hypothetical protein DFO45_0103 [Azorhizobium sp. AG788]|uniref:hypothetical protein n=1 Tax=Azorhizobium sp. AG788 TaxID=2183897 RepID=UPI00105E8CD7|nr:hypothetical protein [Azorhizobium sp. AG788]TDU00605.1 hypothetical protein DFO45_0103 [Azorhizobium sp. AG788]